MPQSKRKLITSKAGRRSLSFVRFARTRSTRWEQKISRSAGAKWSVYSTSAALDTWRSDSEPFPADVTNPSSKANLVHPSEHSASTCKKYVVVEICEASEMLL